VCCGRYRWKAARVYELEFGCISCAVKCEEIFRIVNVS